MGIDPARLNRELFTRLGRVFAAFLFCMIGFSIINLEGALVIQNSLEPRPDIISYLIRMGMRMMRFSYGAAAGMFLVPPMLVIGLGIVLFLERKNAPVSIRFFPKEKDRLSAWTSARGGKIALLIGAGVGTLVLLYILITAFFLPWLGGTAAAFGPRSGQLSEAMRQFMPALLVLFTAAFLSAVLCHAFTAAMGFSLGFLQPQGGKTVIVLLGLCLFLSPVVLTLPYYLYLQELGLNQSVLSLILPALISPLGALFFTWFFRGVRDEKEALAAQGLILKRHTFRKRAAGLFFRFSIPVFVFYFLSSLHMFIHPYTIALEKEMRLLSLFMDDTASAMRPIERAVDPPVDTILNYMRGQLGLKVILAHLSLLQYLLPLALLVISAIFVFPRLALVVRRKGEAAPALDPADIAKLKGE